MYDLHGIGQMTAAKMEAQMKAQIARETAAGIVPMSKTAARPAGIPIAEAERNLQLKRLMPWIIGGAILFFL